LIIKKSLPKKVIQEICKRGEINLTEYKDIVSSVTEGSDIDIVFYKEPIFIKCGCDKFYYTDDIKDEVTGQIITPGERIENPPCKHKIEIENSSIKLHEIKATVKWVAKFGNKYPIGYFQQHKM
jgi:hypothetical protein